MSSDEKNCDVVIIGAGIAGMVTAVRAAELGLSVLVLEKSSEDKYMCNTRLSSGVFHCALMTPSSPAEDLERKILSDTQSFAEPAQAKVISTQALNAIRWLQHLGVRFIKGAQSYYEFILSPPTLFHQNQGWNNKGGDLLLQRLEKQLLALNGRLLRGHQATALSYTPEGHLRIALRPNGQPDEHLNALNVVIADGGFQTNPDLLRESVSPAPEKVFQRNARASLGEGLRMALSLGAKVNTYDGFYGHLLSRDAFHNEHLWPNPWLDAIASAGLLVNERGERFANEGLGGIDLANRVAKLDNPLGAYAVCDERIWRERGHLNMQGPNPKLMQVGATVYKGNSLAELAEQAGIDPQALPRTVDAYNQAVARQELSSLKPSRTQDKSPAFPLLEKPFYIFPVCAGITYTMGGIQINDHAQVLDQERSPLRGLFAVGACTGGLEGGAKTGYVGGLIKSAVMGLEAAQFISNSKSSSNPPSITPHENEFSPL